MKHAAVILLLSGCFGWPAPPPAGPDPTVRKLTDGTLLTLDVNLKDAPGVCPGEVTKLYAKGLVQWPGHKPVMRTIGNDVDSFAPTSFDVRGPLIRGDDNAHLIPSDDVRASIESGFAARVVYKPDARFAWSKVIRPVYTCFGTTSVAGVEGEQGASGHDGEPGRAATAGKSGEPGQPGARGGDARDITAYVTVVATAWYPKLYAVIVNNRFYLAHPERELRFIAAGGAGGAGGVGGRGGNGGWQMFEDKEVVEDGVRLLRRFGIGSAGDGGTGGPGGDGGDGGDGGVIDITWDARFPELATWIKADVGGGLGGVPGDGGAGGEGGRTLADRNQKRGAAGKPGTAGAARGRDGEPGRATVKHGTIGSQFAWVRGIAIIGTPEAQTITTKASLPAISNAETHTEAPP